jgi:4-alpha-glucanotransferase
MGDERTYIKPILRNLRSSHLPRAVLAMLQTRVKIRETLHLHRQMLRDFVQRQETSLRHRATFEIFADECSNGASNRLIESGKRV